MPEVNNPFLDKIRFLYMEVEKNPKDEDLKKQLFELQEQSRAWTQQKIQELTSGIQIVDERMEEVHDKSPESKFPTLNKQYQESIKIYKEVMALIPKIRELKKDIRDEMKIQREAKKNG